MILWNLATLVEQNLLLPVFGVKVRLGRRKMKAHVARYGVEPNVVEALQPFFTRQDILRVLLFLKTSCPVTALVTEPEFQGMSKATFYREFPGILKVVAEHLKKFYIESGDGPPEIPYVENVTPPPTAPCFDMTRMAISTTTSSQPSSSPCVALTQMPRFTTSQG